MIDRGRPLEESVEENLAGSDLEPRDRAFVRLLVTTVARRFGQIDDALARLVDQALPLRPAPLMHILRLGAAQLLFLETPPHAAVATSVELADARGLGRGKGLVNAVLRRLSREMEAILADQDPAMLNTPPWFRERWVGFYGEETVRAIALQQLEEPPLDITLKPGADIDAWAERLEGTLLPTGTLRRKLGGRIEALPGFTEGDWWVQDAAAALPVRLFGNVRDKLVFDLCAAPGGKAAQLAAGGAKVVAIDRSQPRLALVRENFARLGLEGRFVAADALAWEPSDGSADAVLLDAPCTATGTMRRHPDVAHGNSPDDLVKLVRLQQGLLGRAAKLLRPGGMLVYCTCSLEREEGEAQIGRFLADHGDFARVPVSPDEIGGLSEAITLDGDIRTLPCHMAAIGGIDGFFVARLVRKG